MFLHFLEKDTYSDQILIMLSSWLMMLAFVLDFFTGCTYDTAVFDWRSSIPCHCSKNWNSLPSEVTLPKCLQSFKSKRKTRLFTASFSWVTATEVLGIFHFKF